MRFSRPDLHFSGGVLTFIPRVDLTLSSRGSAQAPSWTAAIDYSGQSSYSSTVAVPDGTSFSGQQTIVENAMCGSRYTLRGYQLGSIPLSGIVPSLIGKGQKLDGQVALRADLHGCEEETENRMFTFRLKDLGNLSVGGWRTVR